jgi:transposase InsO family protein
MELARSTFYYRPQMSVAKRDEEQRIIQRLEELALECPRYGIRRMTAELKDDGFRVNRKRVYRLMQQQKLLCKVKHRFVVTTDSDHAYGYYPNLYENHIPDQLDRVWVADITYVRLRKGHVLLAVILDACSRRVIGWELSEDLDASLTMGALHCALALRQPAPGCIHHSDRGVQYACTAYTDLLKQHGFQISMSRKGNPYDNAQAESFMATLKKEEVYLSNYETIEEARTRLPYFIDAVYNRRRRHSALGYLSPVAFELKQNQAQPHVLT